MRRNIDHVGIDSAFQLKPLPVYYVTRHGRSKKFFSREPALRRLAHFMVQKTFDLAGIPTHEGGYQKEDGGVIHFHRGEITLDYWQAHHRCERRIRKLLALKREKLKWQRDYQNWVTKCEESRKELFSRKPF